jgi:hypothetical protein
MRLSQFITESSEQIIAEWEIFGSDRAASGLDSNDNIAKALGAGINEFVPKPYTAASVLRVIRTVLDTRRSADRR